MNVRIGKNLYGKTVAVAVSGGADSMALLHFIANFYPPARIKIVALNVEHGIRGESSLRDSAFVKEYCDAHQIPLIAYKVDALKKAREDKISVEQAARALRYECFMAAINAKKCDAVFTAHHSSDNLESVLFNLFRGTGLKGLIGIKDYGGKIYRPLLNVSKAEIAEYVKEHAIPFVDDETNFCDDYTRNFLRLNVIPKIKEVFPDAEKSVLRLSETVREEDEFLDGESDKSLSLKDGAYNIPLSAPSVLAKRAIISALKGLGLTRDYEKVHVDDVLSLFDKNNGKTIVLPKGILATREYDKITLYKKSTMSTESVPFKTGNFNINGKAVKIERCARPSESELKGGLYADLDKIPENAVIRARKKGDTFTKFGGGTKSLSDYLTDKKIPKKDRDDLLVVANESEVLIIFGLAISDKIKVDQNSQKIIKFI